MRAWLDGLAAPQIVIAPAETWPDPSRRIETVVAADEAGTLRALASALPAMGDPAWAQRWDRASKAARIALDAHLDEAPLFEGSVARDVALALPPDGLLVTSTSLPVRALDAFAPVGAAVEAIASRGANGIDGTTSMALGAAAASGRATVLLTGDVAFLHDLGGLAAAARHGIPLVAVVVDNGGGRIFEQLPQGRGVERETFDDLFATSHTFDLLHAAELFDLRFASVRSVADLDKTLRWAFTEGTGWVIRAAVASGDSFAAHEEAWAKAAVAVDATLGD
jgi:2-succinyl-5-enolpyruvyl-6-hydroxy-3-cyclohexene-1-carboxylate synthase